VISAAENSNKFQKTKFLKEKSVEDEFTLGPNGTGHTLVMNGVGWFYKVNRVGWSK
jgi:hypothetical protein